MSVLNYTIMWMWRSLVITIYYIFFLSAMGSCTISGDPHYLTYDNARLDPQGVCKYVASETIATSPYEEFKVQHSQ